MIYKNLQLLINCLLFSLSVAHSASGDISSEDVISEFKVFKQNQEKYLEKVDVLERMFEQLHERNNELEQEVKRLGNVEKELLNMLMLDSANEDDESRLTKTLKEHEESDIERIPDERLMRHRRQHTVADVTSSEKFCSSPGYADSLPYAINTTRDYRFQTFYPKHTLLLTVVDFVLEQYDRNLACLYDKIIIYDGYNSSAPILNTLCGTIPTGTTFRTSGNTVYILFISDGTNVFKGFNISVKSDGPITTTSMPTTSTSSQPTSTTVSQTTTYYSVITTQPPSCVCKNTPDAGQLNSRIAFTAGVGTFHVVNLGDHHTIAFDKVLTNIGNAYNPNTGIFTAPFKGAYAFSLTFMVYGRHSEYLEIVVDGANINDIFADASSVDVAMSTTKQWVLELNKGSQVWIRTTDYYNQGEIHGNMHTMFGGFLLFEME